MFPSHHRQLICAAPFSCREELHLALRPPVTSLTEGMMRGLLERSAELIASLRMLRLTAGTIVSTWDP